LKRGNVVIMDNLRSNKRAGGRAAIEAAEASLLYPSALQPDLNPIESAFATPKAPLHNAAECSADSLSGTIGRPVDVFTPTECADYFAAAGNDVTRSETAHMEHLSVKGAIIGSSWHFRLAYPNGVQG
jgi:hypothetical protein